VSDQTENGSVFRILTLLAEHATPAEDEVAKTSLETSQASLVSRQSV
jgi:hypothetical protein